jgi:23S rRNA (cytidine1920-2'-O)/16S rRNA (cytidine1409-2'-O)-methyltransferase
MAKKDRLDNLVVKQGLAIDLDRARRLILAGEIRTGDRLWDKAGEKIPVETILELKQKVCPYVSKGGLKLERAIQEFCIDVKGRRCIDIGASTGGFTHVLLLSGAKEIVAVDVGYGLLDQKLCNNEKVIVFDRTNFKNVSNDYFGAPFDIAVADVSFISLRSIIPHASSMLTETGFFVGLIKPQFEARKSQVPEGGVIINPETQIEVIEKLSQDIAEKCELHLTKLAPVPLISRKKNIEFVSMWQKGEEQISSQAIRNIVNQAHLR